ncbi:MAG TPA: hypothetical protein VGQ57_15190, partial [Polyangiaceae bacterium]|nr:hypothetical protein [Polyangiaceae bacterium]
MIGVAGSWARFSVLAAWAVGLAPGVARAAEPAERSYSVTYAAPASCPDRARFLEAVRSRAPGATLRDDAAELAFAVRVAPEGTLASGILTVRFRGGEHFEREVPASPCEDVLTSMAIMAGLLLSGALLPEPAPAPEPPAAVEPAPPAPAPVPVPPPEPPRAAAVPTAPRAAPLRV